MNIKFTFSGWVNKFNLKKVRCTETDRLIDLTDESLGVLTKYDTIEIIEMLNDGRLAISLSDALQCAEIGEIIILDFEEVTFGSEQ